MDIDKILDRIQQNYQQDQTLFYLTLEQVKQLLQQITTNTQQYSDVVLFKEKAIGFCLRLLEYPLLSQSDKITVLSFIQKCLISSKHNLLLFDKILNLLKNDDENVAIHACQVMNLMLRRVGENKQITPQAKELLIGEDFLKLLSFLELKTQLLIRLVYQLRDFPDQFQVYIKKPYFFNQNQIPLEIPQQQQQVEEGDEGVVGQVEAQSGEGKEQKQSKTSTVISSLKSLKFINQVPDLYINFLRYTNLRRRTPEEERSLKNTISQSIQNIILCFKKTPYEKFLQDCTYDFNSDLLGAKVRLLNFISVIMQDLQQGYKRNEQTPDYWKQNVNELMGFLKISDVLKNSLFILRNCSQEHQVHRHSIFLTIKKIICSLNRSSLSREDSILLIEQVLSDKVIYGERRLLGSDTKDWIGENWIELMRSPIIKVNLMYPNFISIKNLLKSRLSQNNTEVRNCFYLIEHFLEEVCKNIFDNSFGLKVQGRFIDLLEEYVDDLFNANQVFYQNKTFKDEIKKVPIIKRVREYKIKMFEQILQAISFKFQEISNTFQEIRKSFMEKSGQGKAQQTKQILLDPELFEYHEKRVEFIEHHNDKVNDLLFCKHPSTKKPMAVYQQDSNCLNGFQVNKNSYISYIKLVKSKLIDKMTSLAKKLAKLLTTQNVRQYTLNEIEELKATYFVVTDRNPLTKWQTSTLAQIMKNGLKIFEALHDFEVHSQQKENQKNSLKRFMQIFVEIQDPINFKDIFLQNIEQLFRNLLKYSKYCSNHCYQSILIDPSEMEIEECTYSRNIAQLLFHTTFIKLSEITDIPDPYSQFICYKQEYFALLQKLLVYPFQCISRFADNSFIRHYFRQVVLVLLKKSQSSYYYLDYLKLICTLFKNLHSNNMESTNVIFAQFYFICSKTKTKQNAYENFTNVNILDTLLSFYDTEIPQLVLLVTEIILYLPLKAKHIAKLAHQGYIMKPLLCCLCTMSDQKSVSRGIKILQIVVSASEFEDVWVIFGDLKNKVVQRLWAIVNSCEIETLDPKNVHNHLSAQALKMLAKLGVFSRLTEPTISMKPKSTKNQRKFEQLFLVFQEIKTHKALPLSMVESVKYALDTLNAFFNPFQPQTVCLSFCKIEKCFELLRVIFHLKSIQNSFLFEQMIKTFNCILSFPLNNKKFPSSFHEHMTDRIKNMLTRERQKLEKQMIQYGFDVDEKIFISSIIRHISQQVFFQRRQLSQSQLLEQPRRFLWGLVRSMLLVAKGKSFEAEIYLYVARLLIDQLVLTKKNESIDGRTSTDIFNNSLAHKNAIVRCLKQIVGMSSQVLQQMKADIIHSVFTVLRILPNILKLKMKQDCFDILNTVYSFMLKDENYFLDYLRSVEGNKLFVNILQNMVSCSENVHRMAKLLLEKIIKQTKLNLMQIFYGLQWWQIAHKISVYTLTQSKFSIENITDTKKVQECPLAFLVKRLTKILFNFNEDTFKSSPKLIPILSNAFSTLEFLIHIKNGDQFCQAFSVLDPNLPEMPVTAVVFEKSVQKILRIGEKIMERNSKLFGANCKTAIDQNNIFSQRDRNSRRSQAPTNQATSRELQRPGGLHQNSAFNKLFKPFVVNEHTFVDDEQYELNIQDFDPEIKSWSLLICSILKFQKRCLELKGVYSLVNVLKRNKIENSVIVEEKFNITAIIFSHLGRVEKSIRQTAYECFKKLLSYERHPKEFINGDEKLRQILQPFLASLQLSYKNFSMSFFNTFEKAFGLLYKCFNITLIQRIIDQLSSAKKSLDEQNKQRIAANRRNTIKAKKFAEVKHEMKCIEKLIGIFELLSYAFYNHNSKSYTSKTLIEIIKLISSFSKHFEFKVGHHAVKVSLKGTLAKVLNILCQKISKKDILNLLEEVPPSLDFGIMVEILKMDESYCLRQRLTRRTLYLNKTYDKLILHGDQKQYQDFLQMIYELAVRNSRWMKFNSDLGIKIMQKLEVLMEDKHYRFDYRLRQSENSVADIKQVIILSKILLKFYETDVNETKYLFKLVQCFKIQPIVHFYHIQQYLKCQFYRTISQQIGFLIMSQYLQMYAHFKPLVTILPITRFLILPLLEEQLKFQQQKQPILTTNNCELKTAISNSIRQTVHQILLRTGDTQRYQLAAELLQVTILMIKVWSNMFSKQQLVNMFSSVWMLIELDNRTIRFQAYAWLSSLAVIFPDVEEQRMLKLYENVVKSLMELKENEYQFTRLVTNSLGNILQYWQQIKRRESASVKDINEHYCLILKKWVSFSLGLLRQKEEKSEKMCLFWNVVMAKHQFFHQIKQIGFQQQFNKSVLLVDKWNHSFCLSSPVIKRFLDIALIYTLWKFEHFQKKFQEFCSMEEKIQALAITSDQKVGQVFLKMAIKIALNDCGSKDDQLSSKRCFYLLTVSLILWPNIKNKFELLSSVISEMSSINLEDFEELTQFYCCYLKILFILVQSETDEKVQQKLMLIWGMLQPNIVSSLGAGTGEKKEEYNLSCVFNSNNNNVRFFLCSVLQRLLKVSLFYSEQQHSIQFLTHIHEIVEQGFQFYFQYENKEQDSQKEEGEESEMREMGQEGESSQNEIVKRIDIEIAILFLGVFYNVDYELLDEHFNAIKKVVKSFSEIFGKGYLEKVKNIQLNDAPVINSWSFKDMENANYELNIGSLDWKILCLSQNCSKEGVKVYGIRKVQIMFLIRALAVRINRKTLKDKTDLINIVQNIIESVEDISLRFDAIHVLQCFLMGSNALRKKATFPQYANIPMMITMSKEVNSFNLVFQNSFRFKKIFDRNMNQSYSNDLRLLQELFLKVYADMLCKYILGMKLFPHEFVDKIKAFVLSAFKVTDMKLMDKVLAIIDENYLGNKKVGLFTFLLQDNKSLYLKNFVSADQILLFNAYYLKFKVMSQIKVKEPQGKLFWVYQPPQIFSLFLQLLRSSTGSFYNQSNLLKFIKILTTFIEEPNEHMKILVKDYLLNVGENNKKSRVFYRFAEQQCSLSQMELIAGYTSVGSWADIARLFENRNFRNEIGLMDKVYDDQDHIHGLRMGVTRSFELQEAMFYVQQRRYIEALKSVQKYEDLSVKRSRRQVGNENEGMQSVLLEQAFLLERENDRVYMKEIIKQCYKNLSKWECIDAKQKQQEIFYSGCNQERVGEITRILEPCKKLSANYYYGLSVLNLMQSQQCAHNIAMCLYQSLVQWQCNPTNTHFKQNEILLRVQCLVELEEVERIMKQMRQFENGDVQKLGRLISCMGSRVRSWRERMPHFSQGLLVWNSILGQRNMLFSILKKKGVDLLDTMLKQIEEEHHKDKYDFYFYPYEDILWNKLQMQKQKRKFQIFQPQLATDGQYFYDEQILKQRQIFLELFAHQKDHQKALAFINSSPVPIATDFVKMQKIEKFRMKAKLYSEQGKYKEANEVFNEAILIDDEQVLPLWRDLMMMSIKAFEKTRERQWVYSSISTLPYALRYKINRTKFLLAPIFKQIKAFHLDQRVKSILNSFVGKDQMLPIKGMLHWLPQIIEIAVLQLQNYSQNENKPMVELLQKLSLNSFSNIFFALKPYLFQQNDRRYKVSREIAFKKMKPNGFDMIGKCEKFTQLLCQIKQQSKIPFITISEFYQNFTEIPIPLVDFPIYSKTPYIAQISAKVQIEYLNNCQGRIITLIGSDGKQYQYRIESFQTIETKKIFEKLFHSQCLQTLNSCLQFDKECSLRNIKLQEHKKIHFKQDLILLKSNRYTLSLEDILNNFLNNTEYSSKYPENNQAFLLLPEKQRNICINKIMRQIVPVSVLKNYFQTQANTFEDYVNVRQNFAYRYGAILALNFILGKETLLQGNIIDMKTGWISYHNFEVNPRATKINAFSIRLSRNILYFLKRHNIYTYILPSMAATSSAISSTNFQIKSYLDIIYDNIAQLRNQRITQREDLVERGKGIGSNYRRIKKALELAIKIGEGDSTPYGWKSWF